MNSVAPSTRPIMTAMTQVGMSGRSTRDEVAGDVSRRARLVNRMTGARGWLEPDEVRTCAECGGAFRHMALLEGLIDRLFAPPAQRVSEFYPRHLKLIELMWTADGRGRETYEAMALEKVSYSQFVPRATELVVRGLAEGWIEVDIP